jgi:hypothetical protein
MKNANIEAAKQNPREQHLVIELLAHPIDYLRHDRQPDDYGQGQKSQYPEQLTDESVHPRGLPRCQWGDERQYHHRGQVLDDEQTDDRVGERLLHAPGLDQDPDDDRGRADGKDRTKEHRLEVAPPHEEPDLVTDQDHHRYFDRPGQYREHAHIAEPFDVEV